MSDAAEGTTLRLADMWWADVKTFLNARQSLADVGVAPRLDLEICGKLDDYYVAELKAVSGLVHSTRVHST